MFLMCGSKKKKSIQFVLSFFILSLFLLSGHFGLLAQKKKIKKKQKIKTFRVDFREKNIHDFLKAMSKIIGKNIIADESVKGKVTVISPERIPASKAFAYLTSVLAVRGYGVVLEDKLLRIISLKDAVAKGRLIHIGKQPLSKDWVQKNIVVTAIVKIVYSDPSRLASILKRITNKNTDIVDFRETDTLILTGGALEVDRLLRIIITLDKDVPEPEATPIAGGHIYIIRLKNMESSKVEATLKKIRFPQEMLDSGAKKKGSSQAQRVSKIDVVSHPESNSIIYVGDKKKWKVIKDLIAKIDVNRDQILLEVLIAEVRETKLNQFGIDLRFLSKDYGAFQSNLGTVASSVTTGNIGDAFNSLGGLALGIITGGSDAITAVLNANVSSGNFLILSAPQILTLNNEEAKIEVGADVPVQTAKRTVNEGISIDQFDYRPTGVKLTITPQINSQQDITLKLHQEIKEISNRNAGVTLPEFTRREIKTTVKVHNEQTIVIGGLISTNKAKTIRKVPFLGDIPLLGYLFRRSTSEIIRTNLLVFITPHILTDRIIADKFTEKLRKSQTKKFKSIK